MTVTELIAMINSHYANSSSTATKISYMNLALDKLSADKFGPFVEDVTVTTVAEQEAYTLPTGLEDVADIDYLAVASIAVPVTRYDYIKYRQGYADESAYGNMYFQTYSSAGVKKLGLYPIPTVTGLKVMMRFYKKMTALAELTMSASPEFDSKFHDVLVYYACYKIASVGGSPDTTQSNKFLQEYESSKRDMWKLRMEREAARGSDPRRNNTWIRGNS